MVERHLESIGSNDRRHGWMLYQGIYSRTSAEAQEGAKDGGHILGRRAAREEYFLPDWNLTRLLMVIRVRVWRINQALSSGRPWLLHWRNTRKKLPVVSYSVITERNN